MNTEQTIPAPGETDLENLGPDEVADALQAIITDIDSFFSDWLSRLEQSIEPRSAGATEDAILRKRVTDFQNEKSLWKAKRKSEQQQIQEKFEQLSAAWLRLEAEQRMFLQIKESRPHVVRERASTGDSCRPTHEVLAGNAGVPDAESSTSDGQRAIHRQNAFPAAQTRDSAVRQFEQLRREIESIRPKSDR